jgi:hypothetical protein
MLPDMLIEVFPRDRESLIAILPEYEGERVPVPVNDLIGKEVPAPEGVTVRFTNAMEFRSQGLGPELTFLVTLAGGVASAITIAEWIIGRFRGRTTRLTINRRIVDLDDEGQIVRVVEEEITRERT